MSQIYYPLKGVVDERTKKLFDKAYDKIVSPEDRVISFIESRGGVTDVASYIVEKILLLSQSHLIPFIAYGGIVFSAASFIYAVHNKRYAFKDSSFLIHRNIPPKGKENDPIYRAYDFQMWKIMSSCMGNKISPDDLDIFASKNKIISAQEAQEIGLVELIFNDTHRNYKRYLQKEGLVL
jgi:ATP-dependent protease ClpP protease subunit